MKVSSRFFALEGYFYFLVFIYRILLDVSYFVFISPRNSYNRYMAFFDLRTSELFLLSWIMLLGSFCFVHCWFKSKDIRMSTIVCFFLYLLSFIPFTTCVYAGILSSGCIFWNAVFFSLLFCLQIACLNGRSASLFTLKAHNRHFNEHVLIMLSLLLIFVAIYISFSYSNLRLSFDMSTVYEFRKEARGYHIPVLFSYLFSMAGMVLPLLLGYFLFKKRFILAGTIWFAQLLHFSVNGSKIVLFSSFLAVFLVLALKAIRISHFRRLAISSLLGLIGMELFGVIENYMYGVSMIVNEIILRRMFFLPVHLKEIYYQFFSTHEPDFFRTSFLRHLGFTSPYAEFGGIPRAIGAFLGFPEMAANNGLFSDAIAHLGLIGVGVLPFAIVMLLYCFDKCTQQVDKAVVVVASVQMTLSFVDSSFFTILLSHGGVLMLFCLSLMTRDMRKLND